MLQDTLRSLLVLSFLVDSRELCAEDYVGSSSVPFGLNLTTFKDDNASYWKWIPEISPSYRKTRGFACWKTPHPLGILGTRMFVFVFPFRTNHVLRISEVVLGLNIYFESVIKIKKILPKSPRDWLSRVFGLPKHRSWSASWIRKPFWGSCQ